MLYTIVEFPGVRTIKFQIFATRILIYLIGSLEFPEVGKSFILDLDQL